MTTEISERSFEEAIANTLVTGRADATPTNLVEDASSSYGEFIPGGYRLGKSEEYDRSLCLVPNDVYNFILATQPKEWRRLKEHYGEDVKKRFLRRLSHEIERRGTLDVLRNGIKDAGCKFKLAFFKPASGLNEELRELYRANQFSVIRQLHYSERNENSLDLALFLNGIPIFTAELKNPLNGQNVQDAIKLQRRSRSAGAALLI